jgi:hypothetical protein
LADHAADKGIDADEEGELTKVFPESKLCRHGERNLVPPFAVRRNLPATS